MADCLLCGASQVNQFLDLGNSPLANRFLTAEQVRQEEPIFPLRVGFCTQCHHVQLMNIVPPNQMFEEYLYVSGASTTLQSHFAEISQLLISRFSLTKNNLVIDIGCNDGTLLQNFHRAGVRTLGVDPAQNLAEKSREQGVDRFVGFFSRETAAQIVEKWGKASVVAITNTFPHIPKLDDFLQGLDIVLAPDGVIFIEAHYLLDLLDQAAFDTIYHEHVSFWSLSAMSQLFKKFGMEIVDAEHLSIHHGQIRAFIRRKGIQSPSSRIQEILQQERDRKIDTLEPFADFAQKTKNLKTEIVGALEDLRSRGLSVVGYGAPAKATTLLNFLEVGVEYIPYIADLSTLKQGLYVPGVHIPIVPPERILQDQPDYVLILAWNFIDEIKRQLHEYQERGGKYILPLPHVTIL